MFRGALRLQTRVTRAAIGVSRSSNLWVNWHANRSFARLTKGTLGTAACATLCGVLWNSPLYAESPDIHEAKEKKPIEHASHVSVEGLLERLALFEERRFKVSGEEITEFVGQLQKLDEASRFEVLERISFALRKSSQESSLPQLVALLADTMPVDVSNSTIYIGAFELIEGQCRRNEDVDVEILRILPKVSNEESVEHLRSKRAVPLFASLVRKSLSDIEQGDQREYSERAASIAVYGSNALASLSEESSLREGVLRPIVLTTLKFEQSSDLFSSELRSALADAVVLAAYKLTRSTTSIRKVFQKELPRAMHIVVRDIISKQKQCSMDSIMKLTLAANSLATNELGKKRFLSAHKYALEHILTADLFDLAAKATREGADITSDFITLPLQCVKHNSDERLLNSISSLVSAALNCFPSEKKLQVIEKMTATELHEAMSTVLSYDCSGGGSQVATAIKGLLSTRVALEDRHVFHLQMATLSLVATMGRMEAGRDVILAKGLLEDVIDVGKSAKIKGVLRRAVQVIATISSSDDKELAIRLGQESHFLAALCKMDDVDIFKNAVEAIANISRFGLNKVALMKSGCIETLLPFADIRVPVQIRNPVLMAVSEVASVPENAQTLAQSAAPIVLSKILIIDTVSNQKDMRSKQMEFASRRLAARTMAEMTVSPVAHEALDGKDIVPFLVFLLDREVDPVVYRYAVIAISNLGMSKVPREKLQAARVQEKLQDMARRPTVQSDPRFMHYIHTCIANLTGEGKAGLLPAPDMLHI